MKTVEDATAAATLIGCGLRPKQVPTRDVVYGDLVRRYREDPAFAQVVNGVAGGLGLRVLDVSPAGGVVLAAGHDSVFEIKMETYARQAKIRERRDVEKVLHGIVHLAVGGEFADLNLVPVRRAVEPVVGAQLPYAALNASGRRTVVSTTRTSECIPEDRWRTLRPEEDIRM